MHPMRLFGWGLLALAFVAASAEMAAQGLTREWGIMGAGEVLEILAPDLLDAVRGGIDRLLPPPVWDYLLFPLLHLPGWLLAGVPGAVLVWRYHPEEADDGSDAYPQTTYEDIVAAAREADEDDIGIPSKYRDLDEYDPTRSPAEGGAGPNPPAEEAADVVPPARFLPPGDRGGDGGGGQEGGGSNRPF